MPEVCLESVPYASRARLVESQETRTEIASETALHVRSSAFYLVLLRKTLLRVDLGCRQKTLRVSVGLCFFLDLAASLGVMLRRLRICRTKIQIVPCRTSVVSVRYASCSASPDGSKIRNIALMAHIGTRSSLPFFTRHVVLLPPCISTVVRLNSPALRQIPVKPH